MKYLLALIALPIITSAQDENARITPKEISIVDDIKLILTRKETPQTPFNAWCKNSSEVLQMSTNAALKDLGLALQDIHQNTGSALQALSLAPKALSIVRQFEKGVQAIDPDFSLRFYEYPLVGLYVGPWAEKSICHTAQ